MGKVSMRQWVAGSLMLVLLAGCGSSGGDHADEGSMTRLADQLRAKGDDSGAAGIYENVLKKQPDDVETRKALGQILEAHGDYAGAAQVYRAGLAITPEQMELLHALGRAQLKQGDAEGAKQTYQQALAVDSDDIKSLNGLGIALDYQGNHTGAQAAYQQALDQDGDDMTTLNNLARSYSLSGAYPATIKLLEPHAIDKKAPVTLRQNLAEAYAMMGMDADAERIAAMDLSGPALANKMAEYHAMRNKVAPTPRLYADLGSFSTEAMAQGRIDAVRDAVPGSDGLVLAVTPDVKTVGGVPHFNATAAGFARAEHVREFCAKLKAADIACKAYGQ